MATSGPAKPSDAVAKTPAKPTKPKPTSAKKLAAETSEDASVLDEIGSRGRKTTKMVVFVYFVSLLFHGALVLAAGLIAFDEDTRNELLALVSEPPPEPVEDIEEITQPMEDPNELVDEIPTDSNVENVDTEVIADQPNPLEMDVSDEPITIPDVVSQIPSPSINAKVSSKLAGRSQAARKQAVAKHGGSAASEKAVSSGLRWLASVQRTDGSWNFSDLPKNRGAGSLDNSTGATGMALICFLGAGHTHEQGSYKQIVERGLLFLMKNMKVTAEGGDLRGKVGSNEGLYVQGICTTALCEAYAMTSLKGKYRRQLRAAAQLAIDFVVRAQDPEGGGWRYRPRQAGDTSVVGWQLMALHSAKAGDLRVPAACFRGVTYFLDSVTNDNGASYGYVKPGDRPKGGATTGCGVLCRMYLAYYGYGSDPEGMKGAIANIMKHGPSARKNGNRYSMDMYHNYYGTQVMHQWGGPDWEKWNKKMRDALVDSQIQEGPEKGSWDAGGGHGPAKGGRLFQTTLAIMCLEVYYRHLPIYKRKNVQATESQLQ